MTRPYAENLFKKIFRKIGGMSILEAFQKGKISRAEINEIFEAEEALGIGR